MSPIGFERIEDLSFARQTLADWPAPDAPQDQMRRRILAFIDEHPRSAHRRECLEGHLTASCLLLDARRERVLLTHHKKLDRWLQFGGHCDGDANLAAGAWRELVEESGIEPAWLSPEPLDLDIHSIPARRAEPEHLHLDVRYLALAPAEAVEICSEESLALAWYTRGQLPALNLDASLMRVIDRSGLA